MHATERIAFERIAFDLDGQDLRIQFRVEASCQIAAILTAPWGRESVLRFDVERSDESGYTHLARIDLRRVVEDHRPTDHRVAIFVETIVEDGEPTVSQLGRSAVTDRAQRTLRTVVNGVGVRVDVGPGGYMLLAVGQDLAAASLTAVPLAFRPRGSQLDVKVRTTGDASIAEAALVLTARRSGTAVQIPMTVAPDEAAIRDRHGHLIFEVAASVDMTAVSEELPQQSDYLPVTLVLTDHCGDRYLRRMAMPEGDPASSLRPMTAHANERTAHYVPYLSFKSSNVNLKVDHFDPDAFWLLKRLMRWAWLMPLGRLFAGVWLIGELPDRAQDNGYHLFRWVRENRPSKRVFYVITADSPDRERLERLGNVVLRGSRQHVWYSFLATRLVSTHLPQYLLPTPDPDLVRWVRGVRVFLQHGIMGMKNMVANYGRRSFDFRCDFFHVSSTREREMIVNDFGYLPEQVRVTGLPRFDALLAPGSEPRGILVFPTWREWLLRAEAFAESDFLEHWRALLGSERLRRLLAAGERVTFILHPNMVHHTELFEAPAGVTVMAQGEHDVQQLLREHRALITDFSSVGFDFALQGRPVYYFQFDRDRFIGRYPSHIDPVLDLPGFVTSFEDELLAQVEKDWQAGFPMAEESARRMRMWIDHDDRHNAERAYRSVKRAGGPRTFVRRIRTSDASGRRYERFRKSPRYAPAMRGLIALARMMPRSQTVVFESGNGRQYAGNPRAIYEELVRRDTGLRTVWLTTSTFRPTDPRTRKVEPRTPRYYWELGRARYWVSDQNLGLDLRPSKRTFYLQCWHGTPLKRMQHDALSHEGRKPGYLERVTQQTGYWSCLLSPSPYATERFRSAFRFTGEVLEVGYPRNDVLAGNGLEERRAATRARLGVAADKRLVLFAPTFRDNVRRGKRFAFKSGLNLYELAEQLPEDVLFLMRAHHVAGKTVHIPYKVRDRIIDVTSYDDAQDLMAAADALITDYSSMMFDFALTGRPLLFFCPDLEEYGTQLRGFYFDFEEQAPGPILRSQEELAKALQDLDGVRESHLAALESFIEHYALLDDGGAAARVVDDLLAR